MDFFEKQDRARRKTRWLIVYFLLAIVGIIATLQVVFTLLLKLPLLDLETLAYVSGGVIVVVGFGSLIKTMELSQGGRVVAAMLGGQPISPSTTDLTERKVLNVVEEMSLASGVPVPEVFLLPDNTINAFAAGHGPGDTAIGVTRGCVEKLSRDELQGVIAHEFSHILHGDMRLNIRLMGLLGGILGLAMIGRIVMESMRFMPMGSSGRGSRDNKDGGANLALVLFLGGLALYLVGWIGVFFGNLIKAAVSRQREFLADASAVQYTRNPQGIAGALWKIGKVHSRLESPRAEEASHLFFGNGLADPWLDAFATHPPIDERLKAIDPDFQPPAWEEPAPATPPPIPGRSKDPLGALGGLLAALPAFAHDSVRNLHGACAFVYALLLDERDDLRAVQLQGFAVEDSLLQETLALFARRNEIPLAQRLPLVDLVIPTLRHLSPEQYAVFSANVDHLVKSDQQIHLFEFALQKTLRRHLDLYFSHSTGPVVKYRSVLPVLPEVSTLLSGLAYVGHGDAATRDAAFAAGTRELMVNQTLTREDGCELARIDAALDRIALTTPMVKRIILTACRQTVAHDGQVHPREYELLRAIADSLDCPLPPLS